MADAQTPPNPSSLSSLAKAMHATKTLKVMLVEDHLAFRQALALLLGHEGDLEVVAQAGSLAEARASAREALGGDGQLDVAVVDLVLPDGEGSDLIGELRRSSPGVSVVILSGDGTRARR